MSSLHRGSLEITLTVPWLEPVSPCYISRQPSHTSQLYNTLFLSPWTSSPDQSINQPIVYYNSLILCYWIWTTIFYFITTSKTLIEFEISSNFRKILQTKISFFCCCKTWPPKITQITLDPKSQIPSLRFLKKSHAAPVSPNGLRLTESSAGLGIWSPQVPRSARSRPCHIRGKQNANFFLNVHNTKSKPCTVSPPLTWVPPPFQQSPGWSLSFRLFVYTSSIFQLLFLNPLTHPTPILDSNINPTPILYL